jgi:CheY-like chemotaxis protein
MAVIDIEDTGPGLSAQEQARIFEPFSRSASAGAEPASPQGAGLGLTIAKMLTDLMGGELSLNSSPGAGAVFRVKLFLPEVRLSAPDAAEVLRLQVKKPRLGYAGARRRVLVVDNEEADRELLLRLLQPLGFELRTAASGHDALDLLATGYRPDVILMDLAMPGIDGWETIRRLRLLKGGAALPVAIVSANAFDKGLDHEVNVPAEDFILKPLRHSELLDWLERRLGLDWLEAVLEPAPAPGIPAAAEAVPSAAALQALFEAAELGFYRGILNTLAQIELEQPGCQVFVARMRELARQFEFESMTRQLRSLLGLSDPAHGPSPDPQMP